MTTDQGVHEVRVTWAMHLMDYLVVKMAIFMFIKSKFIENNDFSTIASHLVVLIPILVLVQKN